MGDMGVSAHHIPHIKTLPTTLATVMGRLNRTPSRSTMRLIGGSSHPELTDLIAKKVGVRAGKVVLGKFANNETNVQLQEQVGGQDVYIIQTGAVDSNNAIMELLLLINSCKLASAETINVVTPYFPYSKGDQKSSLRSPITSKLIANMMKRAGADHLMMLDPHSPQLEGLHCGLSGRGGSQEVRHDGK